MTDGSQRTPTLFTPEVREYFGMRVEQLFVRGGVPGWLIGPSLILLIMLAVVDGIAEGSLIPYLMVQATEWLEHTYPCIDYYSTSYYWLILVGRMLFHLTMTLTMLFLMAIIFLGLGTRWVEWRLERRKEITIGVPEALLNLMEKDGIGKNYGQALEKIYLDHIHPPKS